MGLLFVAVGIALMFNRAIWKKLKGPKNQGPTPLRDGESSSLRPERGPDSWDALFAQPVRRRRFRR
ncbi:hypothetical protein D3105_25165 [Streptomyces globisporus]|uniref:Uncharacterized protein n=1 Tax=Streptomyces globisporus TaxID=1908 RepID=A0A423UU32_STRGL|nr:hypothetical protein D3105_25165 [Streptomyces globisporus]